MLITVNGGGWKISKEVAYQTEVTQCLDLKCGDPTCNQEGIIVICYRQGSFGGYIEPDVSGVLRASGGDIGGAVRT